MRIWDDENDRALDRIMILLTPREAEDLYRSLELMLSDKEVDHDHVNSEHPAPGKVYVKEITIGIYGDGRERVFADRFLRLINEDK